MTHQPQPCTWEQVSWASLRAGLSPCLAPSQPLRALPLVASWRPSAVGPCSRLFHRAPRLRRRSLALLNCSKEPIQALPDNAGLLMSAQILDCVDQGFAELRDTVDGFARSSSDEAFNVFEKSLNSSASTLLTVQLPSFVAHGRWAPDRKFSR